MGFILVAVLGVALMAVPVSLGQFGIAVPLETQLASFAIGTLILIGVGALAIYQRLYKKTRASEAFVRTGRGGAIVIRDGGAFVVPFLHELIQVSLSTFKLRVTRKNEDALITHDKLRADIEAEFFVRVQPDEESILQASRSLGERMGDTAAVKELVEDKLVSALRTVAAGKTLEQLNSERDEFLAEVMKLVAEDLRSNGLILESVTISRLDQTDDKFLKAENIFDAQGRRKIAEITQLNLTQRNRLVRDGERARKLQDVETRKELLALQQSEEAADAHTKAEIAKARAEAEQAAREKAISAERGVELAQLKKNEALELALREQQRAVEVAEREKLERIAQAERARAAAETDLATTEAERELARQAVVTVQVKEAAERDKVKGVIAAEAAAEQSYVSKLREADAEAYAKQKQAEAQKLAANAEAEAIRTRAEAEAEAERQKAAGAKATAMVPVDVDRARLQLDQERIENVVKPELEAREIHGRVAQDFELAQLKIEAEKEVQIAMAQAQAKLFAKMEANLYGTPEDVVKILSSFTKGQSVAHAIGGFMQAADDNTKGAIESLTGSANGLAEAMSERLAKGNTDKALAAESSIGDEDAPALPPASEAAEDDDEPAAAE